MTKRRRERDRPKASPDSIYNPNKRVLLSYVSDEEIQDEPAHRDNSRVHAAAPAATPMVDGSVEDGEAASEPDSNSSVHRQLFEEAWEEDALEEVAEEEEDRGANDKSLWTRGIRRNDATGQWAALGSLSYQWDEGDEAYEDEYDSEEEQAMSYLRAVRSERRAMPNVFKCPNTYSHDEIYESGNGDTRGYYEDGAYVARTSLGPQLPDSVRMEIEPQEAFTRALKERFLQHRDQLHLPPIPDEVAALDEKHPISFPAKFNKVYTEWYRLVKTSVPQRAQIRAMQQPEVLRLVELIQKHYLIRDTEIPTLVSTWIWSLLARLDDVGAMDNDQVWVVRELGRKAVLVQVSFNDSAAAEELERVAAKEIMGVGLSDDSTTGTPEEADNRTTMLERSDTTTSTTVELQVSKLDGASDLRHNTLATLDMIIVLVGEIFEQRDLLDFRQHWNSATEEIREK